MTQIVPQKAYYHLPGLFEFVELYRRFLPLFREHTEYFYPWCDIGSIYGAPGDCLWGGGRVGFGDAKTEEVVALMKEYGISSRISFSNSLIREEHLLDKKCNALCQAFCKEGFSQNGVIVHSDLLLSYLQRTYPYFYYVSSTTKVITDSLLLEKELERSEFRYVVPDFRWNHSFDFLDSLSKQQKEKVELLCNECCAMDCKERSICYENVSRMNLGETCQEHVCKNAISGQGYRFSSAMKNPSFIGIDEIQKEYLPRGLTHFKIEGRSLGSALILEFLLYYMTRPEYHLEVREKIYLDNNLDLF